MPHTNTILISVKVYNLLLHYLIPQKGDKEKHPSTIKISSASRYRMKTRQGLTVFYSLNYPFLGDQPVSCKRSRQVDIFFYII